ncbi:transcriptional regulator with XRE-family HTH domain [Chryseobacterium bernardetii]|jgi:transcriptional regulator with XRE-family HTH domain|uniref:Helix-turn-helix protein n=3 Tax=Chryseobacterium TaxID=59732 RepID=A0A543EKX2_9FLAO|nr:MULTISPECIES: helix-turn-helix transcriptional regulator [Chryseobacterium]MDR6372244.1 transcriptional regulator with XRE-family HTH domain [Chryseobacterium vietnamense]MDR6442372.1 transcriptional regulator with XRE-family HTH domain [Chryseobacterium bernardetii]MDR6458645.1 transcriptional regulator with XRE-family HTH domain [Chryseobacterium vietnamense]TQM22221.1 helix-turn-helix protein [Chryseobacterium aquifrigidense]
MQKEKLRNVRKRKGFTQQQVAEYIATDVSNYSRKESGDVKIFNDEWEKIARFLEVPVEEIFEEEEAKQINHFENNTNSNNIGNVSGNYYCNVPEFLLESQRELIEMLKKENQRLQEELNALKKK